MDKGTLSFSINDIFLGIAFKSRQLMKGPIYPAVSLLNCAGFNTFTGISVPKKMMIQKLMKRKEISIKLPRVNRKISEQGASRAFFVKKAL